MIKKAIADLCREFAQQEVAPRAEEMDEKAEFPYDLVAKMAQMGLSASLPLKNTVVPEQIPFLTRSPLWRLRVPMHQPPRNHPGRSGITRRTPFYLFGTEEQKQTYLVPLVTRRKAVGLRPDGTGSGKRCRCDTYESDLRRRQIRHHGTKAFITNSGTDISGGTTITCVTGTDAEGRPEISNIIVPQETPGFTRSRKYKKMGWRASDTRELSFVDATVSQACLLGQKGKGFKQFLKVLDGGRISVAALSLGLAMGAYDHALAYAKIGANSVVRFQSSKRFSLS